MAYGGQILRSDGSYWLTPDQTPLNLVRRDETSYGNTANVQYYDTGVSESRPCSVFCRITNGDLYGRSFGGYLVQRNGTWQIQLNGTNGPITVRWYTFSNYVMAPTAYDIAYYDASGQSVWNGSSRPLQLFSGTIARTDSTNGGTVVLDAGQTVAVMPSFSGADSFGTYCYKAVGNTIQVDFSQANNNNYAPYYVGVYFYIRTQLYDY